MTALTAATLDEAAMLAVLASLITLAITDTIRPFIGTWPNRNLLMSVDQRLNFCALILVIRFFNFLAASHLAASQLKSDEAVVGSQSAQVVMFYIRRPRNISDFIGLCMPRLIYKITVPAGSCRNDDNHLRFIDDLLIH